MFYVSSMREDNLIEDAVVAPILSYEDFVTSISKMKQDESHLIFPNGVLCYVTPFKGEDDNHTFLSIKTPLEHSNMFTLAKIIVADKTKSESLVLVEDKDLVAEIGLSAILEAINIVLQDYK